MVPRGGPRLGLARSSPTADAALTSGLRVSSRQIVATSVVQGSAVAVAVATAAVTARLAAFWPWFIAPFTATIVYLCGVAISEAHVILKAERR